jgi:hypothetical protein
MTAIAAHIPRGGERRGGMRRDRRLSSNTPLRNRQDERVSCFSIQ